MKAQNNKTNVWKGLAAPLLVGSLAGAVGCLAMLLGLAFAATMLDIPHAYVVPLAMVAAVFGAFLGGFLAAKFSRRNGWLIGLVTSLLLFVFSIVAGIGLYQHVNVSYLLLKCILMLACGMLGGILAMNTGKRASRGTR